MRPEHLNCPNTAEGIRRINEMQEAYDRNPARWEAQEEQAKAESEAQAQAEQEAQYHAEQQAQADQAQYEAEQNAQGQAEADAAQNQGEW